MTSIIRFFGAVARGLRRIGPEPRAWRGEWHLFGLAILSAVILRFAFPRWDAEWVAAIGLVPFLWAVPRAKTGKQAFYLGWTYGIVFYYVLLMWLNILVGYYEVIPPAALMPLAVPGMAIYLGLFRAIFALLLWWMSRRGRGPFAFAALAWVGIDWLQSIGDMGYPWGFLGHALYLHPSLIQLAAWTGVYGLTFVLFWINWLVLDAIRVFRREPGSPSLIGFAAQAVVLIALFGIMALANWDARRQLARPDFYSTPPVAVGIVQPNIAQQTKFESYAADEENAAAALHRKILEKTIALSEDLINSPGRHPALILWPETAITDDAFSIDPRYAAALKRLVTDRLGASLFFGATNVIRYRAGAPIGLDDFDFDDFRASPDLYSYDIYVSGWLAEPGTGLVPKPYNKMQLVPFAEATPFLSIGSSFTHGGEFTVFTVHDRASSAPVIRFGPIICFESVYPKLARGMARHGAELLVVITNDAWYKMTAGPRQHQLQSVFRAVENRRWLARGANHGISCFISPLGEIVEQTALGRDAYLKREIRGTKELTVYTRFGDLFGVFALLATAVFSLVSSKFKRAPDNEV